MSNSEAMANTSKANSLAILTPKLSDVNVDDKSQPFLFNLEELEIYNHTTSGSYIL